MSLEPRKSFFMLSTRVPLLTAATTVVKNPAHLVRYGLGISYCRRTQHTERRANHLTVTWVLVAMCGYIVSKRHALSGCEYLRSALEAHYRKRNAVAHVDEKRVVEILWGESLA